MLGVIICLSRTEKSIGRICCLFLTLKYSSKNQMSSRRTCIHRIFFIHLGGPQTTFLTPALMKLVIEIFQMCSCLMNDPLQYGVLAGSFL